MAGMSREKERLKCDMSPPQPSEHPDKRMHLTLADLYHLSEHPKIAYPLLGFVGKVER
jgi:hypothetical protein